MSTLLKIISTTGQHTDLATCMAEFEEQLRRDPQSFSPLRRERGVLQGEGLAKSAEIGRTLAHFGRPAEAAIEHSQDHGALAFMATEHGTGGRRGSFLVRDPVAHRSGGGRAGRGEREMGCGRRCSYGNGFQARKTS